MGTEKMSVVSSIADEQDLVLYTIEDIQRIFKIGRNKALALMNSAGFPAFRINRKLYVSKKKLEIWIEKSSGKSHSV